ncbi:DNA topoisomerase IB [Caenimonas aquaedulcis]|uniref:DNA topoisomerase n=1 Tax=Caenimonas aquaedulcis TaxID=2793270 RepID=A0A931MIB8_9BURK|nr:DNA topoisomerase IB [Caenimonas aquaedulcis]MBG9389674.1 DNA topoisomerase IB [Caenimonas aquaedulcis]
MLLASGNGSEAAGPEAGVPAGLFFSSDSEPGISRVRKGDSFAYRDAKGRWLRDEAEIARIRKLAIPPAYTDVWICPSPHGHLQATGRDARGRKQYRYHPRWREERDSGKFDRLLAFAQVLPRIRRQVKRDLEDNSHSRDLVLATIVRLLDTTYIRVGNDQYAKENGSFGLTTLRNRHARIEGDRVKLSFRGKSGVRHEVQVRDPRVARVVRRCLHLPGQELFQYKDDAGEVRSVSSGDVNDYLHAVCGERFTAKDFRTWHGSVLALDTVRTLCLKAEPFTIKQVLAEVSASLGNTPAVCRKAYIHPGVLDLALELCGKKELDAEFDSSGHKALSAAEQRLVAHLERQ